MIVHDYRSTYFSLIYLRIFFIWSNYLKFRDINHRITLFAIKKHFGFHLFFMIQEVFIQ